MPFGRIYAVEDAHFEPENFRKNSPATRFILFLRRRFAPSAVILSAQIKSAFAIDYSLSLILAPVKSWRPST